MVALMKIEMTGPKKGRDGETAVKRRPASLGSRRRADAWMNPAGSRAESKLITPNQSEEMLPTRFNQAGGRSEPGIFAHPSQVESDQIKPNGFDLI